MPELIQCPSCDRKLRVPDNLIGKKVKCPSCSKTFVAAAAEEDLPTAPLLEEEEPPKAVRRKPPALPPPEDEGIEEPPSRPRRRPAPPPEDEDEEEMQEEDEETRPRRRRRPLAEEYAEEEEDDRPRRGKRADWQKVRTGVTLMLVAICLLIFAAIVHIIGTLALFGTMLGAVQGGPGQAQAAAGRAVGGALAFLVLVVIMFLSAGALVITGEVFCLFAPSKFNAKTLATTTLVLTGGGIVLYGGGLLLGPFGIFVMIFAALALQAANIVFLFFLRAVAKCLKDWSLEGSARNLTIVYVASVIGWVIIFVLALIIGFAALGGAAVVPGQGKVPVPGAAGPGAGTYVVGCLTCVDAILGVISFIWFIVVLVQTRNSITNRALR
ncbi:MAG TPA: MJ0042-type zinc finger domain-containing protein [Gemmataceae bacterium]|jgi:predicted Zn finger-like uncharacterized protein|nr:MJ0042-type zinc finger domain-containing protein [Gemmataceae bacterium]